LQALIREGPELLHSLTNLLTGFDLVSLGCCRCHCIGQLIHVLPFIIPGQQAIRFPDGYRGVIIMLGGNSGFTFADSIADCVSRTSAPFAISSRSRTTERNHTSSTKSQEGRSDQ
jgi:hypothetical protein